ncbi:NADH-quinone oxidoreductase subunit N [Candidatus Hartigia pinicola]|nr:NADH-quinone oxidoreductase subunit N [Candidatus Hartigia pinicola]
MVITPQEFISTLPLLIVGLTTIIVMLSIAWRRDHLTSVILTIFGFCLSLLSLFFISNDFPKSVTALIRVDNYAVFYSTLVLISGIATSIFAFHWLEEFQDNKEEFYLLLTISVTGGILLSMADHMASMFIGIELVSLPLFGLVSYTVEHQHSIGAGIQYMLLSAVSSSFLLFGIALLYAESGNMSFSAVGSSFSDNHMHAPLILIGLGMLIVCFGFKLSLFPFQLWTPDVYQNAPAPVCAFLASASKISIFAVLMRIFIETSIGRNNAVLSLITVMAVASIFFGNLMAITQKNVKRLLSYSSISHMGYLLITLVALRIDPIRSQMTVAIYLASYLLASLGTFGIISIISSPCCSNDQGNFNIFRGLFWHKPVLAIVLTVMMLSLAGIPITLGFIGKFYVIFSAINAELWWLTGAIIVGSAIALFYYLHFITSLYSHDTKHTDNFFRKEQAKCSTIVSVVCAIIVILIGIWPQPLITIASTVLVNF